MRYWLPNVIALALCWFVMLRYLATDARKCGILKAVRKILPSAALGLVIGLSFMFFNGASEWRRLSPQLVYRTWWAEVEKCTGREGDFGTVEWRVVSDKWWRMWYGKYSRSETAIYLGMSQMFSEGTVKHEMIHALGISPYAHVSNAFEQCAHRPAREKGKSEL